MKNTSFYGKDEADKMAELGKDGFIALGKRVSNWTEEDLIAYYNEICPPKEVKPKLNGKPSANAGENADPAIANN